MEKKVAMGLPKISAEQAADARLRKKKYYAENPEKYRAISAENRAKSPDKTYASSRSSRLKNSEATRQYANQYYKKNADAIRPRHAAQAMKRYAARRGLSMFGDEIAIKKIYEQAASLTKATGIPHDVDHIVPILGRTVCGLHVSWNMQVLSKTENIKKGNRTWPDMP